MKADLGVVLGHTPWIAAPAAPAAFLKLWRRPDAPCLKTPLHPFSDALLAGSVEHMLGVREQPP